MPDLASNIVEPTGGFEIKDMMMRYNVFVPRLYNWCKSLGFEKGKIMPSRAFCSDESQGYPIIMIAKHFGCFPFNHGRVGGIVATDRHGPHAHHGQDMIIIQASHVGYDPENKTFGSYRRLQTTHQECGPSCGKIHHVLNWYKNEYDFAKQNIQLHNVDGKPCIIIDNQLLREDRQEGLLLNLDKLIDINDSNQQSHIKILSTAKVFSASPKLISQAGKPTFNNNEPQSIGETLTAEKFYFKRNITKMMEEGAHHLEYNLIRYMPQIITSKAPILTAAQVNTQIEFDRTFRTIVKEHNYQGKKVLFVSGLNIDISPQENQLFPLTKFVPWAAFLQDRDGSYTTMEQNEVFEALEKQTADNLDQINLEDAIQIMGKAEEIIVEL